MRTLLKKKKNDPCAKLPSIDFYTDSVTPPHRL